MNDAYTYRKSCKDEFILWFIVTIDILKAKPKDK